MSTISKSTFFASILLFEIFQCVVMSGQGNLLLGYVYMSLLDTHKTVFVKWSMPGNESLFTETVVVLENQQHGFVHTINRWKSLWRYVDKTFTCIHIRTKRQRKFQFDDESVLNYVCFSFSLSLFCCCWGFGFQFSTHTNTNFSKLFVFLSVTLNSLRIKRKKLNVVCWCYLFAFHTCTLLLTILCK